VLQISPDALRDGCERAHDLFLLNRLRDDHGEASESFVAVLRALGIDDEMRRELQDALADLVPVKGHAIIDATAAISMMSGVLVGLLIADSNTPADELDLPIVGG
jgi:hypothetical protein